MTIRDMLADGIEIEGTVKVQSWDGDYDYPLIHFEDDSCEFDIDEDNNYLDREIVGMFPFFSCCFDNENDFFKQGICIEVE